MKVKKRQDERRRFFFLKLFLQDAVASLCDNDQGLGSCSKIVDDAS